MLKTFPENASQRKTVAGGRPKLSLASLIGQAILASDGVKARLSTIYEWIAKNYPEYYQLNHGGWQNSIRHNLTINKAFVRVPKQEEDGPGKGAYWTIHDDHISDFQGGIFVGKLRGSTVSKPRPRKSYSEPELQNMFHHNMHEGALDMLPPLDHHAFAEQVQFVDQFGENGGFGDHSHGYLSTTFPSGVDNRTSFYSGPPPAGSSGYNLPSLNFPNQYAYYSNAPQMYYPDSYPGYGDQQYAGTGGYSMSDGNYMNEPLNNLQLPSLDNAQSIILNDVNCGYMANNVQTVVSNEGNQGYSESFQLNSLNNVQSLNSNEGNRRVYESSAVSDPNNYATYYSAGVNEGDNEELQLAKINSNEIGKVENSRLSASSSVASLKHVLDDEPGAQN